MGNTPSAEFIAEKDLFIASQKDLPILDIGERRGWTDYIDFIKPQECSEPIMGGIDCFRRPFITMKGHVIFEDDSTQPFFQTFFKRYTYSDSMTWVGCGHHGQHIIDISSLGASEMRLLRKLIESKQADLTEFNNVKLDPSLSKIKKIVIGEPVAPTLIV